MCCRSSGNFNDNYLSTSTCSICHLPCTANALVGQHHWSNVDDKKREFLCEKTNQHIKEESPVAVKLVPCSHLYREVSFSCLFNNCQQVNHQQSKPTNMVNVKYTKVTGSCYSLNWSSNSSIEFFFYRSSSTTNGSIRWAARPSPWSIPLPRKSMPTLPRVTR